jgi:hypothetical protein
MGKAEFRSLVWGSGTSRYWTYSTPSLRGQSLVIQSEFSRTTSAGRIPGHLVEIS